MWRDCEGQGFAELSDSQASTMSKIGARLHSSGVFILPCAFSETIDGRIRLLRPVKRYKQESLSTPIACGDEYGFMSLERANGSFSLKSYSRTGSIEHARFDSEDEVAHWMRYNMNASVEQA